MFLRMSKNILWAFLFVFSGTWESIIWRMDNSRSLGNHTREACQTNMILSPQSWCGQKGRVPMPRAQLTWRRRPSQCGDRWDGVHTRQPSRAESLTLTGLSWMMQLSTFPVMVEYFLRSVILKFYSLWNHSDNFYPYICVSPELLLYLVFFFKFHPLGWNWKRNNVPPTNWKLVMIPVLPTSTWGLHIWDAAFLGWTGIASMTYTWMDFLIAVRRAENWGGSSPLCCNSCHVKAHLCA